MKRLLRPILVALSLVPSLFAQQASLVQSIQPASLDEVSAWNAEVDRLARVGDLRLTSREPDTLVGGQTVERLAQFHRGVRVIGGDVSRLIGVDGRAVSMLGTIYPGIAIDADPGLSASQAQALVERLTGEALGPSLAPELAVLPRDGGFALAYRARVVADNDIREIFLDAHTGDVLLAYSDLQSQQGTPSIGLGTGVLNNRQKMSTTLISGVFYALDGNRPPNSLITFDMKGSLQRVEDFLNGRVSLGTADRAQRSDNEWTDAVVVDAHAYAGYAYDYFFKRFGRRGLNDNNSRMLLLVHPVRREDYASASSTVRGSYYQNAFYAGSGVVVLGEGLPTNVRDGSGRSWTFLAGALDIVAHELAHGVTGFSSGLIYRDESGALNESFSDIMGAGAEFFFQQAGNGPLRSDWIVAEDAVSSGIRSMANPRQFNHPDHYSIRFTGTTDNGGVHSNSGISNHAFYLAVEGGTHRLGATVQGVGSANREQIERVFYHAYTRLIPAATFSMARAATIDSARQLYGAGSATERAVTQAWTAVGVQ